MDSALASNEGLLRNGPQYVGCLKASWTSITRSAVLEYFAVIVKKEVWFNANALSVTY